MGEAKRRKATGHSNDNITRGVLIDHIDKGAEDALAKRTDVRAKRCMTGLRHVMSEVAKGSRCTECQQPITTPDELGACSVAQWQDEHPVALGIPFCCSCAATAGLVSVSAKRAVRQFFEVDAA